MCTVDPNILKLIEIPITVAGEAKGNVILEKEGERKGLGRIILNFLTSKLKHLPEKHLQKMMDTSAISGLLPENILSGSIQHS